MLIINGLQEDISITNPKSIGAASTKRQHIPCPWQAMTIHVYSTPSTAYKPTTFKMAKRLHSRRLVRKRYRF